MDQHFPHQVSHKSLVHTRSRFDGTFENGALTFSSLQLNLQLGGKCVQKGHWELPNPDEGSHFYLSQALLQTLHLCIFQLSGKSLAVLLCKL